MKVPMEDRCDVSASKRPEAAEARRLASWEVRGELVLVIGVCFVESDEAGEVAPGVDMAASAEGWSARGTRPSLRGGRGSTSGRRRRTVVA